MKQLSIRLLTVAACCVVVLSAHAQGDKNLNAVVQKKSTTIQNAKTVYVDLEGPQGAMVASLDGEDMKTAMTTLQTTEAQKLEKKQKDGAEKVAAFNAKKDTLSPEAREKQEQELVDLSRELQTEVQKAQQYVQREINKAVEQLAKKAEEAAIQVAKAENADVLIEKNTGRVIWCKDEVDVTALVQNKMDQSHKLAANTKKAPAAKTAIADAQPKAETRKRAA